MLSIWPCPRPYQNGQGPQGPPQGAAFSCRHPSTQLSPQPRRALCRGRSLVPMGLLHVLGADPAAARQAVKPLSTPGQYWLPQPSSRPHSPLLLFPRPWLWPPHLAALVPCSSHVPACGLLDVSPPGVAMSIGCLRTPAASHPQVPWLLQALFGPCVRTLPRTPPWPLLPPEPLQEVPVCRHYRLMRKSCVQGSQAGPQDSSRCGSVLVLRFSRLSAHCSWCSTTMQGGHGALVQDSRKDAPAAAQIGGGGGGSGSDTLGRHGAAWGTG